MTVTDSESTDVYSKTILIAENTPDEIVEITGNSNVLGWANETYSVPSQNNTAFEWILPYSYWTGESTTNTIDVAFTNITASGEVECKAVNGCGESNTVSLDINLTLTSVNMIESKINLFPNPAQNQLSVSNIPQNSFISIFDITGKSVFKRHINSETAIINLSSLSNGIYNIIISDGFEIVSRKFSIIK